MSLHHQVSGSWIPVSSPLFGVVGADVYEVFPSPLHSFVKYVIKNVQTDASTFVRQAHFDFVNGTAHVWFVSEDALTVVLTLIWCSGCGISLATIISADKLLHTSCYQNCEHNKR